MTEAKDYSMQTEQVLMIIILDDLSRLPGLIEKLYEAGVPGLTVMNSAGGRKTQSWLADVGLGGLARLFQSHESAQRTLLCLMPAAQLDAAIAAAEQAVGGFGRENSGVLFTIPVVRSLGLEKRILPPTTTTKPEVSREDRVFREYPVAKALELQEIQPVIVPANASLEEVAAALLESPAAHVAAVVSSSEHLLGLVTLRGLADRIFLGIMPELFVKEIHDREQALAFSAMTKVRSVADFMIEPVSVQEHDPVSKAFKLMHEHQLSGLPVVDKQNHVIGFLSLLELLALELKSVKHDE